MNCDARTGIVAKNFLFSPLAPPCLRARALSLPQPPPAALLARRRMSFCALSAAACVRLRSCAPSPACSAPHPQRPRPASASPAPMRPPSVFAAPVKRLATISAFFAAVTCALASAAAFSAARTAFCASSALCLRRDEGRTRSRTAAAPCWSSSDDARLCTATGPFSETDATESNAASVVRSSQWTMAAIASSEGNSPLMKSPWALSESRTAWR